jgi:DNA-binding protein HU-beta
MALTRQDLLNKLSLHNDIPSKAAAGRILDTLTDLITNEIKDGGKVYFGKHFGGFEATTKAARSGKNHLTGKPYSVPSRRAIKFKPSTKLKGVLS